MGAVAEGSLDKVETDKEGRFRLPFEPALPGYGLIFLHRKDRAPLAVVLGRIANGEQRDLGDLLIAKGCRLSGVIRDESGNPLPDTRITIHYSTAAPFAESTRSDAKGRIAWEQPLAHGTHSIMRRQDKVSDSLVLLRPKKVEIPEGEPEMWLEFVFRRENADFISGQVLDEADKPVQGLYLYTCPDAEVVPDGFDLGGGKSRKDGSFRIRRETMVGPKPVRIALSGDSQVELLDDTHTYAWGTRNLSIRVRSKRTVQVRVLEDDSGNPVERFSAQVFPANAHRNLSLGGLQRMKFRGKNSEGRLSIPNLGTGEYLLIVVPEEEGLTPNRPIRFDPEQQGRQEILVTVPKALPLRLLVVDGLGRPVQAAQVQIVEHDGSWPQGERIPRNSLATGTNTELFARNTICLAHGKTKPKGELCLAIPRPKAEVTVQVSVPNRPFTRLDGIVIDEKKPFIKIVLPMGGTLVGSLRPRTVIDALVAKKPVRWKVKESGDPNRTSSGWEPGLRLRRADNRKGWHPHLGGAIRVHPDGSFRIEGIPAGTWDVRIRWLRPDMKYGSGGTTEPIARFTIREGETKQLDILAPQALPGSLVGTLRIDGKAAAHTMLNLERQVQTPGRVSRPGTFETDSEGRFHLTRLSPGRYHLYLSFLSKEVRKIPQSMQMDWALDSTLVRHVRTRVPITILSGKETRFDFDISWRILRVRFLEADGIAPLSRAMVRIVSKSLDFGYTVQTDSRGWVRIEPCLPGPLEFAVLPKTVARILPRWNPEGDRKRGQKAKFVLGPVSFPEGKNDHEVVLRLPDKR